MNTAKLREAIKAEIALFDESSPEAYLYAEEAWKALSDTASSGIELIAAERKRQVEKEGWSESHDDAHTDNELSRAAACYAMAPYEIEYCTVTDKIWPWDEEFDKRKIHDRKKCLVIAGALIAAELDRLIRSEKPDA